MKDGREAGFSLAEALVSLALLGLAATLIAQAVQSGRGAASLIDRRTRGTETVAWAQDTLRRHVEQLYPHARFLEATPTVEFNGSARSLEMQTLVADPGATPGVRREQLSLEDSGRLILTSTDAVGDAPSVPASAPGRVLLTGVSDLAFAYYGVDRDGVAGWRGEWINQAAPPRLVRLRVQFPPGDSRVWPEFLAAPAPDVDDACVLDPQTAQCRGRH